MEKTRAARKSRWTASHPCDLGTRSACPRAGASDLHSAPGSDRKEAWGAPTFRVRDKLFCHFRDNHHGDGRIAIWCKAAPGDQELLVESRPKLFFLPPYVGPSGWVGMVLVGLDA